MNNLQAAVAAYQTAVANLATVWEAERGNMNMDSDAREVDEIIMEAKKGSDALGVIASRHP